MPTGPSAVPGVNVYWTGEVNDSFMTGTNWRYKSTDLQMGSLQYPGDGSTIDSSVNVLATLSNRPVTGTYHFECKRDSSFIDAYFIDVSTVAVGDVELSSGTFGFSGYCMGAITFTGAARLAIVGPTAVIGSGIALVGSSGGTIGSASSDAALEAQDGITGDNFTIDWGNGELDIWGTINATNVTHTNIGEGNLLTPFLGGTLKLGGSAAGLEIDIDASGFTVTPSADISCGSFTLTAGTYGASAYNHTIHGNLIMEVGTLGNQTGTWTMAVDDGSLSVLYNREVNLVVADGVTPKVTRYTYLKSLTGSALAAINIQNQAMYIGRLGNKADKWAFLGSVTGTNRVAYMVDTAGDAVTTPVDIDVPFRVLSSNLSCSFASVSVPTFLIEGLSNGEKSTVSIANLEAATVQIGSETSPTRAGGLVLTGVAKIGSLAIGADNTGANTLHLAGSVRLSGTLDGTDLTITAAAANKIIGGTLTEVDAELTETVRAYRSVGEADASNVNVKFRKRLGSASSGLMNWQSLGIN